MSEELELYRVDMVIRFSSRFVFVISAERSETGFMSFRSPGPKLSTALLGLSGCCAYAVSKA